jgi:hypothetical protein
MFPPAHLPLADAARDAAAFPETLRRPGLVGADLVVPWKEWPDVPAALAAVRLTGAALAVVGVPLQDGAAVAAHLAASGLRIASLEVHTEGAIDSAAVAATVKAVRGVPVFVEPKWPPAKLAAEATSVCKALKAAGAGLKVRCAGPTALDQPAVAAAVVAAADAGLPVKATQGLHHPVPRPDFPHGFLGLLAAVRLRQALGARFTAADVAACLAEADVAAFDLRDGLAWHGHRVPAVRLAALPPFAIGSCSLTEPDDDLMHAFGLPRA